MSEEFFRQRFHEMVDNVDQFKRLRIIYYFIVGLLSNKKDSRSGNFNKSSN